MNRALTGGVGAGTSLVLGLRLLDRLDQPFVPFPEPLICPERGSFDLHLPSCCLEPWCSWTIWCKSFIISRRDVWGDVWVPRGVWWSDRQYALWSFLLQLRLSRLTDWCLDRPGSSTPSHTWIPKLLQCMKSLDCLQTRSWTYAQSFSQSHSSWEIVLYRLFLRNCLCIESWHLRVVSYCSSFCGWSAGWSMMKLPQVYFVSQKIYWRATAHAADPSNMEEEVKGQAMHVSV